MAKRTIIFRADGGSSIGMGHFIRTLALAEMLNEHFYCIYATRQPSQYQISDIGKVCHDRLYLPENDSHFEMFLNYLEGDEIVVLDNYYFSTEYQKSIKAKGCKLVCIDDIHDKYYAADIVFNHAPLSKELFSTALYTKLFVGFEYALLRSSFLQNHQDRKTPEKLNAAFLCMGGADFNNLTSRILDDLMAINQVEAVTIVVGNAYQFFESLKEKVNECSKRKQIKLLKNLNPKELIKQIRLSDFAIVPCSTILLEVISQKLPVLTGYFVDNQKEVAKCLDGAYKNIFVLGDFNEIKIQQRHINYLDSNLKYSYSPAINNGVKERFIAIFNSLVNEFQIKCRKAKIKDIDVYFSWANNEAVRKNAINPEKIEYQNHVNWFRSKIYNEESFLYIFEKENIAIGQVRFDKSGSYYIVDYSVAENFRGQGFGTVILKLGMEELQKDLKNSKPCKIKAQVKLSNKASSRVFERFNFFNTGIVEIENNTFLEFEKEVV